MDPSKAIGHTYADQAVSWTKKDLVAYAVGIGCGPEDLQWVYELDPNFAMFPTYPVVLGLKGTASAELTDFNAFVSNSAESVPGLPAFDPRGIVHGAQSIEILGNGGKLEGKEGWVLRKRVVGVVENKSGVIVDNEAFLVSPSGRKVARLVSSTFNVGGKITGAPFSKSIASAPSLSLSSSLPKNRKPDHVVTQTTAPNQALVYRLSGDYNPLHIDPTIGTRAGFGGVILHGLATYGFAARAVLQEVRGEMRAFGVRFTSPVKPGDTLETSIWELGVNGDSGLTEVAFVVKNVSSGKVCLGNGMALVKKASTAKL